MFGLGTIINVGGILLGGILGLVFGNRLEKRYQDTLMVATAVCVLFLGISGALQEMMTVSDGKLSSGGTMMMIGSFAIGSLIGEWMNVDYHMERFGEWLKVKTGSTGDAGFVNGFVTASLTVCIGAMAVVGAIQDGISGDYSTLAAKAVLDLIIIMIMTASMGKVKVVLPLETVVAMALALPVIGSHSSRFSNSPRRVIVGTTAISEELAKK